MTLASPYNFATTDRNRVKLFGGNVVQVPTGDGGPNSPYSYAYMFANWSSVFPNWIVPQLKRWRALGANTVRMIGGLDGVFAGAYTQSAYEACVAQLLAQYRSLGLWFGGCQMALSTYPSVTGAQWNAALGSLYANVLNPNADIVAYMEPGMQESTGHGSDTSLSISLAQTAKGLTTIPVLLSSGGYFATSFAGSAADVISTHWYPDFSAIGTDLGSVMAQMNSTLSGMTVPTFVEECGLGASRNQSYQQKADFYDSLFRACAYHPDCAGLLSWGGFGPTPDGDWTVFQPPAGTGADFNPASVWADTVASTKIAGFGPKNRNMAFTFNAPAASLTGAYAALPWTVATGSVASPGVANFALKSRFRRAVNVRATGTMTAAGGAQLRLVAIDQLTSGVTVVAGPVAVSGTQPFGLTGPLAANGNGVQLALQASGSGTASIAAGATIAIGNAPGTGLPVNRLNQGLTRPLARPIGRTA